MAERVRRALTRKRLPAPVEEAGADAEVRPRCAASGWQVHDRYAGEDDTTACPWCGEWVRVVAQRLRRHQVRVVEHH